MSDFINEGVKDGKGKNKNTESFEDEDIYMFP